MPVTGLRSNLLEMQGSELKKVLLALAGLSTLLLLLVAAAIFSVSYLYFFPPDSGASGLSESIEKPEVYSEEIQDGFHVETGFIAGEGLQLVIANCTNCHSAKLVTQNRFTKEGWTNVIRWMQETQGLWDLGANEEAIVAYLSTHYAPEARGRRKPLEVDWYDLE
jgi:hypothetical protein